MAEGKKNTGRKGTLVFVDETGFSESPAIRRTWAPRGQTPVLRPKGRNWERMSAIGGLAYRRDGGQHRVFVRFHMGPVRAPQILAYLKHLMRHVSGRVTVIWDRLQGHRALLVRDWVDTVPRLNLVLLPPYAPELNPVEGLWAWMKGTRLANVCEDTIGPVAARAKRSIRVARSCQRRLHGFLRKAGLSL